jgi:hypothetical protein
VFVTAYMAVQVVVAVVDHGIRLAVIINVGMVDTDNIEKGSIVLSFSFIFFTCTKQ